MVCHLIDLDRQSNMLETEQHVCLSIARVSPGKKTGWFESEKKTLNPLFWMLTAVEGCTFNIFAPYHTTLNST